MGAAGSGRIIVTDAEVVDLGDTKFIVELSPGNKLLPRLDRYSEMYERYRILRLQIEYMPLSGYATTGNITATIQPGVLQSTIKDKASACKCQPLLALPAWKAGRLVAGPSLDAQRFLHCDRATEDGVAATIYCFPSAKDLGQLRIHYTVEFAFPRPF